MKVKEIIKITHGKLISGDPDVDITPSAISTDSRTMKEGDFFIALTGRNFDGNDFAENAFRKLALGVLVTRWPPRLKIPAGGVVIEVKDTNKALGDIAHHHRMKFKIPVIGVTGSSGKTTVKEIIWHMLSAKYNVLKNEGTKNNNIGVPQTLLKLKTSHDICVLELGTNHRGEIRVLSEMARPDIAVITNIGPSHLEFLKDLKGVFEAKKEMLDHLTQRGLLILNGDDAFLSRIKSKRFNIKRFGLEQTNDLRASNVLTGKRGIRFTLNDKWVFDLKLLGEHNVYNALAAIAVARHFNISPASIKRSLATYKTTSMRLDIKRINGIDVINDSYNSNPLSMECALNVLKEYPARARWVVSGDMLELGKKSAQFHKILGKTIARSGVEGLFTLGGFSRYTSHWAKRSGMSVDRLRHCRDHKEIVKILIRLTKKGDAVLVKGSRAMRMERVVAGLMAGTV